MICTCDLLHKDHYVENQCSVMHVVYRVGVDKYDIGFGFGHFGIAVDDVSFC